ncbi:MAG: hypothetical protein LBM93_12590 [Oscillospiraceae bacterium]|jgi:hypothetical protein|nr:hypothetical protein [Oscillospiraceae bacterium]
MSTTIGNPGLSNYDLLESYNKASTANQEAGNVDTSSALQTTFDEQNVANAQKLDTIKIGSTEVDVADSGIYDKKSLDRVQQIQVLEAERMDKFNQFVQSMLQNQSTSNSLATTGISVYLPNQNGEVSQYTLNPTEEDITAAQAAIAEGGEYSVDKVATRIMDMANALSGLLNSENGEDKIATLRAAVEEGFKYVTDLYGDSTPQITKDTYTEVMKRFDEWTEQTKVGDAATQTAKDTVVNNITQQLVQSEIASSSDVNSSQTSKQAAQGGVAAAAVL